MRDGGRKICLSKQQHQGKNHVLRTASHNYSSQRVIQFFISAVSPKRRGALKEGRYGYQVIRANYVFA